MNIILLFVVGCSTLLQTIDSKKFRGIMSDEVFDYDLDNKVPSFSTYFSLDHLILNHIDDDTYFAGGYIECIRSIDRNLPIRSTVRTQYYQNSKCYEGEVQLVQWNMCEDYINRGRFWYNATKLWTSCPPQKGDKWFVNNQTLSAVFNLPSLPVVPWRGYIKAFQGISGFEKHIFGFGIELEFIQV